MKLNSCSAVTDRITMKMYVFYVCVCVFHIVSSSMGVFNFIFNKKVAEEKRKERRRSKSTIFSTKNIILFFAYNHDYEIIIILDNSY